MVFIPKTPEQAGVTPLPRVRQAVSAIPAAFGAVEAAAIQEVGGALGGVSSDLFTKAKADKLAQDKIQHNIDSTIAGDAFVKFNDGSLNIMNTGLSKQKGEARGASDVAAESFTELKKTVLDGLTPVQLQRAESLINPRITSNLSTMNSHVRTQYAAFNKDTFNAVTTNEIAMGTAILGDATALPAQEAVVMGQVEGNIKLATERANPGASLEEINAISKVAISTTYEQGIALLASTNAPAAKIKYDSVKDKIDPGERAALLDRIKENDTTQKAWDTFNDIASSTDDFEKQMEKANALPEGEVGTRVKELLAAEHSTQAKIKADDLKVIEDNATTKVIAAKQAGMSKATALNSIAYTIKDSDIKKATITFINKEYDEDRNKLPTDYRTYDDIMKGIDTGQFTSRAQIVSAASAGGGVRKADLDKLIGHYEKGGAAGQINYGNFSTLFNDVTKKGTKDEPEAAYWALAAIEDATIKNNGVALSPTQKSKIISDTFASSKLGGEVVSESNWIYDPDKKAMTAIKDGPQAVMDWQPDLTKDSRQDISGKLFAIGKPTTEANIRSYAKGLTYSTWLPPVANRIDQNKYRTALEADNTARIREGKRPLLINDKALSLYYKHKVLGIEYIDGVSVR